MVEFENPSGGKKALKRADRGYTGGQGIPITAVLAPESGCPPPSPPQTVGMLPLAPGGSVPASPATPQKPPQLQFLWISGATQVLLLVTYTLF